MNRTDKKYTMIVFEEDERYGSNGIQLDFYADNPCEGYLSDIVYGDDIEELEQSSDGHSNEGLFYLLYENESGKRIGSGTVDFDAIEEDILEAEIGHQLDVLYKKGFDSKDKVKTICYGETREWDSREDAMRFFLEAMYCSDGSERERYTKIYTELTLGLEVCSDGLSAR